MATYVPDAMPDIRSWLRDQPDLRAYHSGRVFFRLPATISTWPVLRLYRSGGGIRANTEPALLDLRVAIDIWGGTYGDYPALRKLAAALESAVHEVEGPIGSGATEVVDALVTAVTDSPDPETGNPRLVVDTRFSVIAAGPA